METFSSLFQNILLKHPPKRPSALPANSCVTLNNRRCMICPAIGYDYNEEINIKNEALKLFWQKNKLKGNLQPIHPSPLGRGYRTNSKRRVFRNRDQAKLGLTEITRNGPRGLPVIHCPIEPASHAIIYDIVQKRLMSEKGDVLRKILNYVIIRGDYQQHAVLFSIKYFNPEVLREMNRLSKEVTGAVSLISGVFIFQDKPSSHYISSHVQSSYTGFRKLYGKNYCTETVGTRCFHYSPLVFSQTNSSITAILADQIIRWLKPEDSDVVFDLYSGYGLFGLSVADKVRAVIGADQSYESVDCANKNGRHFRLSNMDYFQKNISPMLIPQLMKKHHTGPVKIILDPPRAGTPAGLIENIDPSYVAAVIHLFCDIESVPHEFRRWERSGFQIAEIMPFDMFPATDQVEMVARIIPALK